MTTQLLLRQATRPFATLAAFAGARAAAAEDALTAAHDRVDAGIAALEPALHAAAGEPGEAVDAAASGARWAILALKRAVHNRRSWRGDEFEEASTRLPPAVVSSLLAHRQAVAELRSAERAFASAVADDLARGREAIARAVDDPLVAAGIALASRSMLAKLRALAARDAAAWGHAERHVAAKALAYLARFATKTSPNSLFCATALAEASGGAARVQGRPAIARVDLILNVAESRKVASVLAADPAAEGAVFPRPNPTLRPDAGGLTFWRFAAARNPNDDESLSRLAEHPVALAALEEAAGRPGLAELSRRVAARCGIDEGRIAPFLREMIARGVLIGEIEIPYNERRPLRFVATRARDAGCAADWVAPALAVEDGVDRLAGLPLADLPRGMSGVAAELSALPHTRPIGVDELFRLDAASGLRVTLPDSVVAALRRGLRPYTRLFATLYPARLYLHGWVTRFLERFPADTDVPLLDVYRTLTEQGDTYRPAAFPEPSADGERSGGRSAAAMAAVTGHLAAAARAAGPGDAIPFDDAILDRLVPGAPDPRWACGVLFQVAAADVAAIERGDYHIVLNGIFHGAGLSLSRFAHLLGGTGQDVVNPVVRELRRAWSILERPGAIVAELTYNHLGRTANAGLRPSIFTHEIELPGDCASPGASVLALADLSVRLDGATGRFTLRRAGDAAEVIPVINSGVNPVGFVSFLVAIGEQGLQPIGYFPGFDAPGVTHWPRVVADRVVLFRERWVLRRGQWPEPPGREDDLPAFVRAAFSWRRRWALPRHVFVHSSKEPKPRYFDLASPLFLDLLRRDLGALAEEDEATVHVTEMFPGPDQAFVRDDRGSFATEFLVQLDGGALGSPR